MAVRNLGVINWIADFKCNAALQNNVLDPAVLEDDAYIKDLTDRFLACANLAATSLQAYAVLNGNDVDGNLKALLAGGFRGFGSWLALKYGNTYYYTDRKTAESYPALAKAFAAAAPREKQKKIYGRAALCCLFFDRTPAQLFGAPSLGGDPAGSAMHIEAAGGERFPFYTAGGGLPEKKQICNPSDAPVDIELGGRRVCLPPGGELPVILCGEAVSAVPANVVPAGAFVGLFRIGGKYTAAGTLDSVTGTFTEWTQKNEADHAIFVNNRWRTIASGCAEIDGVTVEDAIALAGSGQAWCVLTAKGAVVSNLPALSADAGAVGVACIGAQPTVLMQDGSVRSVSGNKTYDDYCAALLSTFPKDNSIYARICSHSGGVLSIARDGTLHIEHNGKTEATP